MSADMQRLREARPADDLIRPIPSWELDREPPEREWMVERCFPKGTVAMLSGDGAIGKSLLMQQMCTAAVMGQDWLGLRLVRGNTAFFSCEDDHTELHKRHKSILEHLQLEHPDLEGGLHLIDRVGSENALAAKEQYTTRLNPTPLTTRLLQYCLQHGIVYLVIDTATQTFVGNQNDEGQVRDYINILRRIAIAIQGVVIITKHPSFTGRSSGTGEGGSVAWNNGVRSRLYMRRDAQGPFISGMKANYSDQLGEIRLSWDRGVFVVDAPSTPPPLGKMELKYRLIQGLTRVIGHGGKVAADELHRESMHKRARATHDPLLHGVSFNEIATAQAEMLRDGEVVLVSVGGRCLLRPKNGPAYQAEEPWLF